MRTTATTPRDAVGSGSVTHLIPKQPRPSLGRSTRNHPPAPRGLTRSPVLPFADTSAPFACVVLCVSEPTRRVVRCASGDSARRPNQRGVGDCRAGPAGTETTVGPPASPKSGAVALPTQAGHSPSGDVPPRVTPHPPRPEVPLPATVPQASRSPLPATEEPERRPPEPAPARPRELVRRRVPRARPGAGRRHGRSLGHPCPYGLSPRTECASRRPRHRSRGRQA